MSAQVEGPAIDFLAASVIILISVHFGLRRQEAQCLGCILRPKPRAFSGDGKFNAVFYLLVSRDIQELCYANRRQQFLVEKGSSRHVRRDESVHRMDGSCLAVSGEGAQLLLPAA